MSAALVFAAAPVRATARLRRRLTTLDSAFVVAADAGAATAFELGFTPDLVVGDFDSIDPATLERLQARAVPMEVLPRDKDATDGELAIQRALQQQPSELLLVGFLGGPRLDQELASVLLLGRVDLPATLLDGANEGRVLRAGQTAEWSAEPAEIVSLIPLVENATGVRTHGLRWPLDGDKLRFGSTRGVSNEPCADRVAVSLENGLLLVTRHFPGD